jgi:fibro-slime domain-containing protein
MIHGGIVMRSWAVGVVAWLAIVPVASAGITLSGTVRDFQMRPVASQSVPNPDFEYALGDDRGIVTNTLGLDGKPLYNTAAHPLGTATTLSNGGISATTFFNQWYNDSPGYNIPIPISITLGPIGGGFFQYSNYAFFPIDGLGFGNQGKPHNFNFTLEVHAGFDYTGSGHLTFVGDDDVFVYINNHLVIDLGGVHGAETASIDVSTLGLTTGNNYALDVFYAERHTTQSDFAITTDLTLTTRHVPEPGALFIWTLVAGVFSIGGWRTCLSNRAALNA